MAYTKDKTEMVRARLTPVALSRLDSLADEAGVTRSEMLRRALEWYIGTIPVTGKIQDGKVILNKTERN